MTLMTAWPEQDREWVTRYRASIAGKAVPAPVLEQRERELLDAVTEAGVPATELFGDAGALAVEDATELGTADEAVRTSEGGGLRGALKEVGGTLTGIGAVALLLMFIRQGWSADVDVALLLVAASVVVGFLGWTVGRWLFSAGQTIAAAGALVAASALALAGIASAANLGAGHIAVSDAPVLLLGLGMLAPGIAVLAIAKSMPQHNLRQDWDDADWLSRFRGGLRARLVPAATARAHVTEIQQTLTLAGESAHAEFGHPLVLARELAEADQTSRTRRWWASTITGTATPLAIAALVLTGSSWGSLTIPAVVFLIAIALITPAVGWGKRPWGAKR